MPIKTQEAEARSLINPQAIIKCRPLPGMDDDELFATECVSLKQQMIVKYEKKNNKNIFVYNKTKLCLLCGGYMKSIKIIVKSLI